MANGNTAAERLHDLDALRSVALFLGIVLHSAVFVLPEPVLLWPIHDASARGDPFYKFLIETIHGFRMPVFFLLSGFFSALLWRRRGLRALAAHRLKRVGLPFAVGCFTVVPLSIWLLSIAGGGAGSWNIPLWALPLVWLFGSLAHLWFLWYLLLIVGVFVVAARLGARFRHPVLWWLAVPLSMAFSLLMVEPIYGADNADTIVPQPSLLAYYACFFAFGAFFHCRGFAIRRRWTVALAPAAVAFYAGFHLLELHRAAFGGKAPEAFMFASPLTAASAAIETLCAWAMCFGLMGFFRWVAARESAGVRWLSDSTYWAYLAHLPLVVAGQMLTVDWPIHYHLKFLLVCGGVTAVLLVVYRFGVRYTFVGTALNGPRARPAASPA